MGRSATEIAGEIRLGWNIGNTLEATGGETSWGNPAVTEGLIRLVKSHGFNAVRIPCAWDKHADPQTAKIDTEWLDRVHRVVEYCMDNGMYVCVVSAKPSGSAQVASMMGWSFTATLVSTEGSVPCMRSVIYPYVNREGLTLYTTLISRSCTSAEVPFRVT